MSAAALLVYGEALADLIPRDASPTSYEAVLGGSGFNTALALARFGASTGYCATLSSDALGARFRRRLAEEGVDARPCGTSDAPTPLAVVAPVGADGEASYHFHLARTALERAPSPLPEPGEWGHLHLTSFAATAGSSGTAALDLAARFRAGGRSVSYDLNIRSAALPDREETLELVERRLACCALVKASREDIAWLHPGADPGEVAARWLAGGVGLVLMTHGSDGATAHQARGVVRVEAPRVAVVDTIGAGDAFMAGFLAALAGRGQLGQSPADLEAGEIDMAMRFAAAVAADTCTRPGCDPPRRAATDASAAADRD